MLSTRSWIRCSVSGASFGSSARCGSSTARTRSTARAPARAVLVFVQPETVIAWQRKRFREHWAHISRKGTSGRPPISENVRALIHKISAANPRWGAPRIVGELRKLGVEVAKEGYRRRVERKTADQRAT
jgi:hypothetical protein